MVGIFDIDSLIYEACYGSDDLEEAIEKFYSKYNDAVYAVKNRFKVTEVIPVGFCTNNYRKKVDLSYKANRTSDKPKFFEELIQFVKDNLNVQNRKGIETDDLVVKYHKHYGKDNSIIISIDKDYQQVEGTIYNYRSGDITIVSKEGALYNFYSQMVIGDQSDNVNYIKGKGKKWCEANLLNKSEYEMRAAVYRLFKGLYRSKAKEMYIRCYLLLRLDVF
ncbi:MAG: hypothetical protein HQ473_07485 [Cryomorphaceae bacterium]|nr:hypothetical protein [Cryomorphaceae bacterium]